MKVFVGALLLAGAIGLGVWIRLYAPLHRGNGKRWNPGAVSPNPHSPLRGKTIFCLGSSVTAGMSSGGVSFADYIAKMDGCTVIKEAVSASTLADRGRRSYLRRLVRHPAAKRSIDCFLCQLSTNDAAFRSELGQISDSYDKKNFDTKTTLGAMEYIIVFARETWSCPVVFFTGTKYDNPRYHYLVNQLLELGEKWEFEVIDLWHSAEMNSISPEDYNLYMSDGVHPTKAGYLKWWTPEIQKRLYAVLAEPNADDIKKL